MLKRINFYCHEYDLNKEYSNTGGAGFDNDFEVINNRVVYDKASGLMWQRVVSENIYYWSLCSQLYQHKCWLRLRASSAVWRCGGELHFENSTETMINILRLCVR